MWTIQECTPIKGKSLYQCDCGVTRWVVIYDVNHGKSTGCGCVGRKKWAAAAKLANTKHGATNTPEFTTWTELRRRCRSLNRHDSKNYSQRGITFDSRWDVFDNFLQDMGKRPDGCSLDRINNNLGYFKGNCRWSTRKEQERNKRTNRIITIFCEQIPVCAACEFFGISANSVYQRLNRGWPPEMALLTPSISRRKNK